MSAMWKQTNLGYLRVDLLGCRLRLLANGEPSLLDSVLDSTPLENMSVNRKMSSISITNLPYDVFSHVLYECWKNQNIIRSFNIVNQMSAPLQGFTGTL